MVSELIGKYIWLLQTISASGETGMSIDEIIRKYERRFDQPYSRRSFNNHRLAAQDTFGISIECNRRTNRYYIPNSDSAMDGQDNIRWMIDTFTVGNLLTLSKERLSGRVAVEEVPSGQKYLTAVMQAMEGGRELEIVYSKYRSGKSETLHVQPFAVKEHERRWYLVGFCRERAAEGSSNTDMDAWRVYGMDRIFSLIETDVTFTLPDGFDVDALFCQSYGIFFPKKGQSAVRIRFRTTEKEASYLRDLPIHRSQREEAPPDDGNGVIFSIKVIPNENLMMELCRHAGNLEVLEPEDIRNAILQRLRDAIGKYESDTI